MRGDDFGEGLKRAMERGTIYTETVIHSAPEAFLADAPYQLVIVSLEAGGRRTGRMRPGDARGGPRRLTRPDGPDYGAGVHRH